MTPSGPTSLGDESGYFSSLSTESEETQQEVHVEAATKNISNHLGPLLMLGQGDCNIIKGGFWGFSFRTCQIMKLSEGDEQTEFLPTDECCHIITYVNPNSKMDRLGAR
jgi:hypothetical protein